MLAGDIARWRDHRCRAEKSDIDAGRSKASGRGGDREIAARDELTTSCGRNALNLRDHGFRVANDRLHQLRALRKEGGEGGLAFVAVRASRGHLLQVMA